MPSKFRNVVAVLQQRQLASRNHIAVSTELQRYAEEKAALAEMQEIHCQIPSSVRSTFLTSFSPDGTKVASTHGDHKIYICDVRTGKLLHKLEGHLRTPWCLSFHPTSNDILASGCLAGEVRVWHLHGGSEKWRNSHCSVITSLAFHPLDQMLVIATSNEIHFWDWSLPKPFAFCTTNCPDEKVRFVKFDRLGNRLITGIAVLPDNYPGPSSLPSRTVITRTQPYTPQQAPSRNTLSHRRSLLNRLMNMYQHIDAMDDVSQSNESSNQPLGSAQEEALNQARRYAEATTHASRLQRQLREQYADQIPDPNAANLPPASDEGSSESRDLLDSHEEFLVQAFWRTFHRLRSICTTLERRMYHLQRNTDSNPSPSDARFSHLPPAAPFTIPPDLSLSPDRIRSFFSNSASAARNTQANYWQVTSNYLINVLTRLQLSSLSSAVAQEQLQQLQYRISEIVQRLTNVTGYRARLTTLRDQIFEVAERAQRRGSETSYVRRLDLAHCLWLVEMSLQLTQQMQRILHADYRLTQLHINTSRRVAPSLSSELPDITVPEDLLRESSPPMRRNSAPDVALLTGTRDSDAALQSDLDAIARGSSSLEAMNLSSAAPPTNVSSDASLTTLGTPSSPPTTTPSPPTTTTPPSPPTTTTPPSPPTTTTPPSPPTATPSSPTTTPSSPTTTTPPPPTATLTSPPTTTPSSLPSQPDPSSQQNSSDATPGTSSSTAAHNHSTDSSRGCEACGTQGATANAGSSDEFDEAWDRLRVVVRQELETLTERFRGNAFPDLDFSESSNDRARVPRRRRYLPSAYRSPVFMPQYAEPHGMNMREPVPTANTANNNNSNNNNNNESGPSTQPATPGPCNRRRFSVFENTRPFWGQPIRPHSLASHQNNPASSIPHSFAASIRHPMNRVPEIHIVPSAEEVEPSVLLPVHERPRSPPLSAILSGSNDPVLSTMVQAMYDTNTRTRLVTESHGTIIHRIQSWDFSKYDIPSIKNTKANVVVRRCKIHNDASVDISSDGEMLVALLPPSEETLMFAVFSLKPESLGQILLVSHFDSNAISLSFSPLSQYIVVGLATPRPSHSTMNKQAVAQIFELKYKGKSLTSSHVRSLTQDIVVTGANHSVSLNSVQWLPRPGEGLIYGTNRGCLCICKPISPLNGRVIKIVKNVRPFDNPNFPLGIRYRHFGTSSVGRMFSASTQTMEAGTQTTGTQTGGDSRTR